MVVALINKPVITQSTSLEAESIIAWSRVQSAPLGQKTQSKIDRETRYVSHATRLPLYFGLINAGTAGRALSRKGGIGRARSISDLSREGVFCAHLTCMEMKARTRDVTALRDQHFAAPHVCQTCMQMRNSSHVKGCKLLERNNLGWRI